MNASIKHRAEITITLKPSVLDPQGQAIENALRSLGFAGVDNVRQGKIIMLDIAAPDTANAEIQIKDMCEKLLANPVVETYRIVLK